MTPGRTPGARKYLILAAVGEARLLRPPPGNLGVFADLFGQRLGNQPIQSGCMAPPPVAPPRAVPRSTADHAQLPAGGRGSAPA